MTRYQMHMLCNFGVKGGGIFLGKMDPDRLSRNVGKKLPVRAAYTTQKSAVLISSASHVDHK